MCSASPAPSAEQCQSDRHKDVTCLTVSGGVKGDERYGPERRASGCSLQKQYRCHSYRGHCTAPVALCLPPCRVTSPLHPFSSMAPRPFVPAALPALLPGVAPAGARVSCSLCSPKPPACYCFPACAPLHPSEPSLPCCPAWPLLAQQPAPPEGHLPAIAFQLVPPLALQQTT